MIPFIRDGDFSLSESNAILKYLAETRPTIPSHLWPEDPKQRALVDQYLEFYQYHFRPGMLDLLRIILGQKMTGAETPEEVKKLVLQNMTTTMVAFEAMLKQHKGDFLVGNEASIADLQCFFEFTNIEYYNQENWQETYPTIAAWYEKMKEVECVK